MKTKIILCLFVFGGLSLLNLSTAGAENCSPVDVSSEMGPIRNQGDIGWCYANAAADLLTHRHRHELKGQEVSALYMALLFNKTFYNNEYFKAIKSNLEKFLPAKAPEAKSSLKLDEGGFISLALKTAETNGFCPRTKDDELSKNSRISLKKKLEFGLILKSLYDQNKVAEVKATLKKIRAASTILDSVSDNRVNQILADSTSDNFLVKIADEICEGGKLYPKTKSDIDFVILPRWGWVNTPLFWKMDQELDAKRPVGVTYHSVLLDSFKTPIPKNDRHASIVVGREMRDGQCHYKIRNSWGGGCNYKNPALQNKGCDGGNVWVPREQFKRYLYAVVSIKEK